MITYTEDAIQYLSRLSNGGMRDAITLMDKCLAYSTELTVENVIKALGTVDYDVMFNLTDYIYTKRGDKVISIIELIHSSGKDLKQFVKLYMGFLLDMVKYDITKSFEFLQIPKTAEYEEALQHYCDGWFRCCQTLLDVVVKLNSDIKWDTQPKITIEATLLGVML